MGTRVNKFQSSEILCLQIQAKFHHQFHLPEISSVSYKIQHSFSTFGVARNVFFLEDISADANACAICYCLGFSGPFVWDKSPKPIYCESLGEIRI